MGVAEVLIGRGAGNAAFLGDAARRKILDAELVELVQTGAEQLLARSGAAALVLGLFG